MAPGPAELLVFFAMHGIFGLFEVMLTFSQPGCSPDWSSVNMEQTWIVCLGESLSFLSLLKNP
uniref:Uncharacterized protein n=1 Tax=Mus musculus TaxID=10090 RepID=Q3UQ98_MOUSE|nr:unnamed protein product [Mus musculus]